MGINAQTSVPKFTSGDVLTAANTNLLTNAPPVFSGTATRDAAFGGAGEKTLAEGQLCYLEDSNIVQYYDGAAWASVGSSGLTLINRTSFSGVASQTFDGVFTSTYGSYLVIIESLFGATATSYISWQWRYSSTTQTAQCNSASPGLTAAGAANNAYAAGATECVLANTIGTTLVPSAGSLTVSNVGLTATPIFRGTMWTSYDAVGRMVGGNCEQQRNYDGFLIKASSGNVTGIVAVYGLAKS